MKQKIIFQSKTEKDLHTYLEKNKKRNILNFLNLHDLYQSNKEELFQKALLNKSNLNFIDGFIISAYFSLIRLKRTPRIRGPTFTKSFISDPKLSGKKKLSSFFGALGEESASALENEIKEMRKVHRKAHSKRVTE